MQRLQAGVWALSVTVGLAGLSGCMATRKYVRNEVKTSSDALSADIEESNGQIRENRDSINRVNERVGAVDGRVTSVDQRVDGVNTKVDDLDARTTQSVSALKGDVNNVSAKTDATNRGLENLDQKFQNRNNYSVSMQRNVLFGFDSSSLNSQSMAPLDEIAGILKENPDAIVVLEGHTDSTGNRDYNVQLGERRVESVRRYLAVDKGVPVYKIEQISFGAERPVASNDSRAGREQNRSVTLSVMVPSSSETTSAANR